MECIFCKIIAGQVPCDNVYEDADVVAFLDIAPINPGHTLVVARQHYPDLVATPPDVAAALMRALQAIAPGLMAATGAPAFNVGINNGAAAGQLVPHVHFHLIPRPAGDGLASWPHQRYAPGEAAAWAQRIRGHRSAATR